MKQGFRCQRILILSLLSVSVFAPLVLVSNRLKHFTSSFGNFSTFLEFYYVLFSLFMFFFKKFMLGLIVLEFVVAAKKEFVEDLSSIFKFACWCNWVWFVTQETGKELKEPTLVVYKDVDFNSVISGNSSDRNLNSEETGNARGRVNLLKRNGWEENQQIPEKIVSSPSVGKGQSNQTPVRRDLNVRSQSQRVTDEKVKEMKDQVIRAKAYLNFAPPDSNPYLVTELKVRIKEVERAVGAATKDSDLSRSELCSALQRMRSMEASLSKASRIYTDCSAMATKLRAMTYNAEEQVRTQKNQVAYLAQLASRTTPKGLHCLSMRLTADYFALQPEERELPNQHKLRDPDLYHHAVFSDNVLACAVVVNSTISVSMEPEKIVFHVVTNSLNLPAVTMWFYLNPPGKATIQIQSIDDFKWLSSKYGSISKKQKSRDHRYTSAVNHLRFYLPDVFPALNKIVLLDHDVVVQRDLRGLWSVGMKGKVNGAVETCREGEPSFHQMDMVINFSDPIVAKRFDVKACTWAFGMNLFDLREWRRRNLTAVYHKYLQLGDKWQLWKAGSLPLGLVTFYNQTVVLDRRWHVLGLGYESGVGRGDIERAAVIHYDGNMKPWLEIGIGKYKGYWSKYINYDHPYLQQCNIHE
ncbi:hypothetical protein HHK36_026839 [Tetracentron sinense]|uniref:Hexosyltransferase n=1 Tax=Tetracentron sinense TaxID=13715 RepID=A0A835D2I0_TETSI|nr:hypothetical protein HHK36_026839 [Tetracentron sinense]